MKMEHIRTFLEIAVCGNFNRAAETLHVTQSTVSARVKTMEEAFGRPLFRRSHSGVELTPAGHRFHRYALGMHRLWLQSHQELSLPEGFAASLALGAQVSLWERLVLHWIGQMRVREPGVALRVEADFGSPLMRQLSDGLIDIGVMYEPRHIPGFAIEKLFEETLVLVSTRARALQSGWVEDYVFVDWGDAFRAQHGEAFPEMETPAVSIGMGALALRYLILNGGSAYFPWRMVAPLLERGNLHEVSGAPRASRSAYVVYSTRPRDEDTLGRGLALLRETAQREAEGP